MLIFVGKEICLYLQTYAYKKTRSQKYTYDTNTQFLFFSASLFIRLSQTFESFKIQQSHIQTNNKTKHVSYARLLKKRKKKTLSDSASTHPGSITKNLPK